MQNVYNRAVEKYLETGVAQERVKSEITGKVWKILTREGAVVEEEETLIIIESMKMEIPVWRRSPAKS